MPSYVFAVGFVSFALYHGVSWSAGMIVKDLTQGSASWWHVVAVPSILLAAAGLSAGRRRLLLAWRLLHRSRVIPGGTLHEQLEFRTYVLYLRAFGRDRELRDLEPVHGVRAWLQRLLDRVPLEQDRTWEERLIRPMGHLGRVICVGQPGERVPPLGADRYYLPHAAWKPEVSEAIERARLVVMVASIGPEEGAEGTLWEYTEAIRLLPPEQFVLIIPRDRANYDRFRDRARRYVAQRARTRAGTDPVPPSLPELPNHPMSDTVSVREARRSGRQPWVGALTFHLDHRPELTLLTGSDPSEARRFMTRRARRKAAREAVRGFIDRLEVRLPGRAVERRGFPRPLAVPGLFLLLVMTAEIATRSFHLSRIVMASYLTLWALDLFNGYTTFFADKVASTFRVLPPELAAVHRAAFPAEEAKVAARALQPPGKAREFFSEAFLAARPTWIRSLLLLLYWTCWVGLLITVGYTLTPRLSGPATWSLWHVLMGLAFVTFVAGCLIIVRRLQRPRSPEDIRTEPSTLLLRPVAVSGGEWSPAADEAMSEVHRGLKKIIGKQGAYVVAGAAGEKYEKPTSDSSYGQLVVPVQGPRAVVSAALLHAQLVMAVAMPGAENAWRFTEAVRLLRPEQAVLVVCSGHVAYEQFRGEATAEFIRRKAEFPDPGPKRRKFPRLPRYPAHGKKKGSPKPPDWTHLAAIVTFTGGWEAQVHRLYPPLRFACDGANLTRKRIWEILPQLNRPELGE